MGFWELFQNILFYLKPFEKEFIELWICLQSSVALRGIMNLFLKGFYLIISSLLSSKGIITISSAISGNSLGKSSTLP